MSSFASILVAFLKSNLVRWTVLSLFGLVVVGLAGLYGASEWRRARTYESPTITLRTTEPASAERGERLAAVFGCSGCHGTHGRVFMDAPGVARVIAPDLARTVADYSDDELIVLVRAGIKRDHTSLIVMSTESFSSLADGDIADIVAWLRALKPETETETKETIFGPLGRLLLIRGALFSADAPRDPAPPIVVPTAPPEAHGAYLVRTVCMHCHLLDEERELRPGLIAPPVRPMTQSYDLAQFMRLMRKGEAIGDRKLGLMSDVSLAAFSHLTEVEIAAIHAYLNAPVEQPASGR